MFEIEINNISELPSAAISLLNNEAIGKHFAFYGKMGAGKTTFIKELCKNLMVIDITTSPSFSIINEYLTQDGETVYHIDLYRLKHMEEALDIGIEEILYSEAYIFIEWPQIIEDILPESFKNIKIDFIDEDKRSIKVTSYDS